MGASRCEHFRAYPGGQVRDCDRYATRVFGWRELCDEHWLAFVRQPDLRSYPDARPNPEAEMFERETRTSVPSARDRERVGLSVEEEAKFRDVLVVIFNAPDYHSTNEVP